MPFSFFFFFFWEQAGGGEEGEVEFNTDSLPCNVFIITGQLFVGAKKDHINTGMQYSKLFHITFYKFLLYSYWEKNTPARAMLFSALTRFEVIWNLNECSGEMGLSISKNKNHACSKFSIYHYIHCISRQALPNGGGFFSRISMFWR